MKGNFLHIGSVVLGFVFAVQGVNAQLIPDEEDFHRLAQIYPEEISQIDAEEASGEASGEVTTGNDESRIRFSDFEEVIPSIQVPSQQSSSAQLAYREIHVYSESVDEQFTAQRQNDQRRRDQQDQQDQQYRWDRGNQDHQQNGQNQQQNRQKDQQRNQNQQDQRYQENNGNQQQQDQQNRNQNRNQQDREQWFDDDMNCPSMDSERCYFNDTQQKRCGNFGGVYRNDRCYMEENTSDNERQECEDRGGIYMNDRCYIEQPRNARLQHCDDMQMRSEERCTLFDARRDSKEEKTQEQERKKCEERGGEYERGTCSIDYGVPEEQSRNQNNQNRNSFSSNSLLAGLQTLVRTEKREKCEDKGGEYIGNGKCIIRHYDQDKCDDKDGIFYNGECYLDSDDL